MRVQFVRQFVGGDHLSRSLCAREDKEGMWVGWTEGVANFQLKMTWLDSTMLDSLMMCK
jgi:hypothetical protein